MTTPAPRVFTLPEMPADLLAVVTHQGEAYSRITDQPDDISPEAWCLNGDWTNHRPVSWVALLADHGPLTEDI